MEMSRIESPGIGSLAPRKSCEERGVQKELAKDSVKFSEHQEPALA